VVGEWIGKCENTNGLKRRQAILKPVVLSTKMILASSKSFAADFANNRLQPDKIKASINNVLDLENVSRARLVFYG